jgi:AraC family transcriptional regulator, regulatory protein of adaptative response / methylated-DNA-[protein]-cysteine methyltransferase
MMTMQLQSSETFPSDSRRWQAVARRDAAADGTFVYAVKTTGVYCRPSCAARLARRKNVEFFATPADAEREGFRACKRCKPGDLAIENGHADAIARACKLIEASAANETPPDVEALAAAASMSPSHFHRVFKSQTGVTPKAYAIAHRAQRVRDELAQGKSVTSAMYHAGFNSNGRFYATATKTLGMKPAAFRAGGAGMAIRFAVGQCSLGSILVAASDVGICAISLGDDPDELLTWLKDRFRQADFISGDKKFEKVIAQVVAFVDDPAIGLNLPLDVRGTAFQQRVWKKLAEIPLGATRTYSEIARELGLPKSTRAVGAACGANPIAVAIPCHRVVASDGALRGYRWGVERKAKLLKSERAAKGR